MPVEEHLVEVGQGRSSLGARLAAGERTAELQVDMEPIGPAAAPLAMRARHLAVVVHDPRPRPGAMTATSLNCPLVGDRPCFSHQTADPMEAFTAWFADGDLEAELAAALDTDPASPTTTGPGH